ncbi:unnamed protein product [Durusdinium trenchii]|uniref:Uncharacterized protein n=1 Tax=Durusdinium trenchii TaxID=1381693 RepID=A0ABP0K9E9_9DINO
MAVRLLEELAGKVAESQGDRMGVLQGALPAWLEYVQSLDDAQAVEGYLETAPHGLQHAESDAVRSAVIRKLKSARACGARRKQQDYFCFPRYLTLEEWGRISSSPTERVASEVLADVLYARMGLRAPTEATYAMCVAVLAHTHGHLRDTTFQLGTLLQTMKQAWRAHFRRHDVKGEDECLLELLPKESSQIPLAAKERLNLEALTPEDRMPVSWAQLTAFAPRVRLRQSRPETREQAWMPQLAELVSQLRARDDGGLRNLKIFPRTDGGQMAPLALGDAGQDRTGSLQEVAVQSLRDLPGPPAASHREAAGQVLMIHAEPSVAGDGQCAVVPLLPGPSLEVQETQTETPPPVEDEVKAGGQFLQKQKRYYAQKSVAGAQASDGDQAKPGNITFEAKGWGPCKAEFYTHKSYIRHMVDGRLRMIIGSTATGHASICRNLVRHVKSGKTREALTLIRDRMVQERGT